MNKIYILSVEDEVEVQDAIIRDLADFEEVFPIETAASAQEARDLIASIEKKGDYIGVIFCDHIMTGQNGVDLLVELHRKDYTRETRKVLVTAHAGLEDTVEAVNKAELGHYISKPWKKDDIQKVARTQLSEYILAKKIPPLPYMKYLDPIIMGEAIREGLIGDR